MGETISQWSGCRLELPDKKFRPRCNLETFSQRNFPSAGRPRLQAHMGTSVVGRWDLNPRSPVPETSLCNLLGTPDKQAIYWLYYLLLNTCSAAS